MWGNRQEDAKQTGTPHPTLNTAGHTAAVGQRVASGAAVQETDTALWLGTGTHRRGC